MTNRSRAFTRSLSRPRQLIRIACLVLIGLSVVVIASHATSAGEYATSKHVHRGEEIESAAELTVTTTHFDNERNGSIAVFDDEGELVYQNASYTRYFDVDTVSGEPYTVLYVAEQNLDPRVCGIQPGSGLHCITQYVEKLDLVTDESEVIYSHDMFVSNTESWHDVDQLENGQLLVADIHEDRVFIVDPESKLTTWSWSASSFFPLNSGGSNKDDWTHLNDVELVRDGVVMTSPRNQDQVIFLDRESGVQENWTLGADNDHETLYEQHNPDYIPTDEGGPALLIADSQNTRIIEYQRRDGGWRKSWVYTDPEMAWPRDADRLPNGNTLITDTNSNRIYEINKRNEVVWDVTYPKPYEAERLGTGDESAGGRSAEDLGLESVQGEARGSGPASNTNPIRDTVSEIVPTKIKNAISWVLPSWAGFTDVVLAGIAVISALAWLTLELYWTNRLQVHKPISLR